MEEAARAATAGSGGALPHKDTIQPLFGHHDISGISAHTSAASGAATEQAGAQGLATGSDVAFASVPDLHLAAHEAAHVVQQRGGVQLKSNVGEAGDAYERNADAVADRVVRGESAEGLLDAFAPSGSAGKTASDAPVQLSIGCHPTATGHQFQIDGVRPGWEPHAAAIAIAAGEDRCHIIGFEVIQNDLANILNQMLATRGTPGHAAQVARLNALCTSLFTTPGAPTVAMNARRAALIATFAGLAAGVALTGAQAATLTAEAGSLLSALNSCPDNLRAGDSGLNHSIGYNVDADFLPGTLWYHGPIQTAGAAPPPAVPPGGTAVAGPGAGPGAAGPFECVRLTPAHESKVYNYQNASTLPLSFVLSGIGGAQYPGTAHGQQLSSTQMPTVANKPVIVMGAGVPLVYR